MCLQCGEDKKEINFCGASYCFCKIGDVFAFVTKQETSVTERASLITEIIRVARCYYVSLFSTKSGHVSMTFLLRSALSTTIN
jgi:hypothetical protein